jgi:transposase InsO family protein
LTVTDHASRFLLTCEALSSTRENYAFTAFERLFKERGLPANIRSDNGVPFASAHALFNLSKLAVSWLRLVIGIERIQPGHPQQNGRHERMHPFAPHGQFTTLCSGAGIRYDSCSKTKSR